jgi:preprotein translocase subunit SecD
LRSEVEALGFGEPIIQTFGAPNEISIRLRLPEGSDKNPAAEAMAKTVTAKVKAAHADARIDGIDRSRARCRASWAPSPSRRWARQPRDLDLHLVSL